MRRDHLFAGWAETLHIDAEIGNMTDCQNVLNICQANSKSRLHSFRFATSIRMNSGRQDGVHFWEAWSSL